MGASTPRRPPRPPRGPRGPRRPMPGGFGSGMGLLAGGAFAAATKDKPSFFGGTKKAGMKPGKKSGSEGGRKFAEFLSMMKKSGRGGRGGRRRRRR